MPELFYLTVSPTKYVACVTFKCQSWKSVYIYLYILLDLTRHEICISTRVATLTIHARKKYIVNEHIIHPGITCIIPLMVVISCNKLTFPLICLLLLSQTGRHHGCFQVKMAHLGLHVYLK